VSGLAASIGFVDDSSPTLAVLKKMRAGLELEYMRKHEEFLVQQVRNYLKRSRIYARGISGAAGEEFFKEIENTCARNFWRSR
jgi:hypothetical protein